jgi:glycosyltransferase involved in cell wall biosynthesis
MLERRDRRFLYRVRTNALCRFTGLRMATVPETGSPIILHQALASTDHPYVVEYDVPLAIHGYNYSNYLRHVDKARRLLEHDSMRVLFVFSEWAKRSFALHFGKEAAAKCKISYPLASSRSNVFREDRRYDFAFISTKFRVKGGLELIRAFKTVRHSTAPDLKMCVVTNLDEARELVGELTDFSGIEWRAANLDEAAIATLLSDTHCLVHPTLWESFGVVVLEALAAGCAVITSHMASLPELVTNESGILLRVPIGQVVGDMTIPRFSNTRHFAELLSRLSLHGFEKDLTAAMVTMATDRTRRARYQEAARILYRERFSAEAWKESMRANLRTAFPDLETR